MGFLVSGGARSATSGFDMQPLRGRAKKPTNFDMQPLRDSGRRRNFDMQAHFGRGAESMLCDF
jgi:hypothetical protein